MKEWIIICPDGVTIAPNEEEYENFQVLGFITAETEELALDLLKIKYPFVNGSGFDEVWIYPLESGKPFITYLSNKETPENEFEKSGERNGQKNDHFFKGKRLY
ncbi:hypothetical protein [Neobacillus soli]|uniref:hypothetical protein n=1 Tax=Neobacillus soli TaxID=220688 RepID=UPI0008270B91|nr:hypothetical protein [Neobacillus soli]